MTVSVCIPWRPGDPARETNLAYVRRFWSRFGWSIIEGDSGHTPFNRAAARNHAARASDSELVIFADADIVGEPDVILRAATIALDEQTAVWPHNLTHLLAAGTTRRLLAGGDIRQTVGQRLFHGSPCGILIVHRRLFEQTGGWDEGFDGGWGFEDVAYKYALTTLADTRRLDGRLWHLWHPTAREKQSAIAYRTPNRARRDRYGEARGNPEAMRRLLGELVWSRN